MSRLPGISREDEEKKLKEIMELAQKYVDNVQAQILGLSEELHTMMENFHVEDKEMQALWNNTDARFKEVNRDLLRAQRARKKPYFGRIDFTDDKVGQKEVYYIGRSVIAKDIKKPEVIDWRAPIASVYYDHSLGEVTYKVKGSGAYRIHLERKRTYEIEGDELKDFYDSDVVANDDLLTKYLAKSKRNVLGEIIATIQSEQNEIIRKKPQHNLIVQGAAGSGKTTVAMHRISYILYNYGEEFAPEDFYIIGSNQVLLNYITGVLPELDVYGVSQMTMEQLFCRLLYEDYDKSFEIKPVVKGVTPAIKGTFAWFEDLERFCRDYERRMLPIKDVVLEKTKAVLLTKKRIESLLERYDHYSFADKKTMLTEQLMAKLENELTGRYYSYSADERVELTKYYSVYFGKREWKGSVFELYRDFLDKQSEKGMHVSWQEGVFDVYDLAAVAYLYKKIKESDVIREAAHVVIDEAQDFGMMAYASLKYCLSKCTYTIMGDVSQNISMDYGLNDWKQLQKLMLPDDFDTFELLRKSYRNTIEIAKFATDILYHGSFDVYPIEPIIRHGEEVQIRACASLKETAEKIEALVAGWKENGLETIAVICANAKEAKEVSAQLSKRMEIADGESEELDFSAGVMVLPLELTKGLEFDGVIIYDASKENYPFEDGYAKRLYVAATRALHCLEVFYQGELTRLISDPVPEERKKQAVVLPKRPKFQGPKEEPDQLTEEIHKQIAVEGEQEMRAREQYGPKRIVINKVDSATMNDRPTLATSKPVVGRKVVAARPATNLNGKATVTRTSNTGNGGRILVRSNSVSLSSKYDLLPSRAETMKKRETEKEPEREFGSMPSSSSLSPAGHSRVDASVRFVMKEKQYVDVFSAYGVMRVIPVDKAKATICFVKGQNFPKERNASYGAVRFMTRETREAIEIVLEKMTIRINRKSGAISFLNEKGKCVLAEREREPRFVESGKSYVFFPFDRKEMLLAQDEEGNTEKIAANAVKYISCGPDSPAIPTLTSSGGFELSFPAGKKTLCCNNGVYGPYVMVEDCTVGEYTVRV